ncbi:class I SAM-dependent methyltransferase [Novispirillum itersonii]|uniref:SAM-dependent methyltransferase n=1 Tax=Novispirillum itersonii TaxID=189 RepID=A0A7W9ZIJ3_NOVIT|nr:class I SAM-dependent methyltransferase [Novispirillum itersonii]MBB6212138.1 SAM-dependent methyltransferase [Novispirillum itersonii]
MMTPSALFDLIQAPIRWEILRAALELGIVDDLADGGGRTVAETAAALSLDPRRTGLLLNAMTALGICRADGGRYSLPEDLAPYLCRDGARSMRDLLLTIVRVRHGDVTDLVRQGDPGGGPDMASPAFWDRSADSLRAFHRAMGTETALSVLRGLPEWASARRILDLGAGSERLALALAAEAPAGRAVTVLDLPPMADRIRSALARSPHGGGAGAGVQVIAGDFNAVPFGGPYDVIWAAMTLYFARDLGAVLTAARQALASGGVFVSFHEGLSEDRTGPETHVIGRLVPSLRGRDPSFHHGQIAAALRQAGFPQVDSVPVETPFGPMQADIARVPPP